MSAPPPRRALILVENLSVPFDRRVWREALTLRDAGWRVCVVSPRGADRDTAAHEVVDGIEVRRFRLVEAEGGLKAYVLEYGLALASMFLLALRFRLGGRLDVIQICNPPDLLVFAGLRAEKFIANKEPEKDLESISIAMRNIESIKP
ncbi:MAG TPA: glycosyltransferase, partial [Candidatus Hydrogenedentes bacterium]|nr:glycosyltransferase [Candidatus Hydrogenedentota bacterium]